MSEIGQKQSGRRVNHLYRVVRGLTSLVPERFCCFTPLTTRTVTMMLSAGADALKKEEAKERAGKVPLSTFSLFISMPAANLQR